MSANPVRIEFSKKIRDEYIQKHPMCEYCGNKAEHVHHIIPVARGGDNRESNLMSLCLYCHGLIHNKNFVQVSPETRKKHSEATKKGLAKAKAEGKRIGRPKKTIDDMSPELIKDIKEGVLNPTQLSRKHGCARQSIYNYRKIIEETVV